MRSTRHAWLEYIVENEAVWPYLDLGVMRNRRLPIFGWNCDLPNTVWIFLHGQFFSVPVIYYRISRLQFTLTEVRALTKITNKECFRCIGSPFPVCYVVVCVDVESKLLKSLINNEFMFDRRGEGGGF